MTHTEPRGSRAPVPREPVGAGPAPPGGHRAAPRTRVAPGARRLPAPRDRRTGPGLAIPALPFASAAAGGPSEPAAVASWAVRGRLYRGAASRGR
ncbi:hypothetical protein SUDANB96_00607 [Streptomyces sp. enrichment culture]